MSSDDLRISGVSQVNIDRDIEIYLEKNTYVAFHFFYDLLTIQVEESTKYQYCEEKAAQERILETSVVLFFLNDIVAQPQNLLILLPRHPLQEGSCGNPCPLLIVLLLLQVFHSPVATKVKISIDLVKDTNFINISANDSLDSFIAK